MSCGCKNKQNQTQTTQQTNQTPTPAQPQTQPIQESVRKVVERYYTKK